MQKHYSRTSQQQTRGTVGCSTPPMPELTVLRTHSGDTTRSLLCTAAQPQNWPQRQNGVTVLQGAQCSPSAASSILLHPSVSFCILLYPSASCILPPASSCTLLHPPASCIQVPPAPSCILLHPPAQGEFPQVSSCSTTAAHHG